VELAGVEVARVVEGAIGGLLLVAVLAIAIVFGLRWQRERRPNLDPGIPALARYGGATSDSTMFGGGASTARVQRRTDLVCYGYLGVAEQYTSEDGSTQWCTLNVTLPGRVPYVVADNRAAVGHPDVPAEAPHRGTLDDQRFDTAYVVGAEEPELIGRVLSPAARELLLGVPIQRLILRDSSMLLRTFDGAQLDDDVIDSLASLAAQFLASTPSFVISARTPAGGVRAPEPGPLPEGLYGPDRV
jgi:hypothetical protein